LNNSNKYENEIMILVFYLLKIRHVELIWCSKKLEFVTYPIKRWVMN